MQHGQQNGGSTEESMGRPKLRAFYLASNKIF